MVASVPCQSSHRNGNRRFDLSGNCSVDAKKTVFDTVPTLKVSIEMFFYHEYTEEYNSKRKKYSWYLLDYPL